MPKDEPRRRPKSQEQRTKKTANVHGKTFEVIKASKRDFEGMIGRGRELKFGKSGTMILHDADLAREINQKYGPRGTQDVYVSEIPDETRTRGRRNLWVVGELPWKVDEDGETDDEEAEEPAEVEFRDPGETGVSDP